MQKINDKQFYDDPYEPHEDSYLLQKHIKEYAKGDVLDMCTGSGILGVEAANFAEKVVAVDINQRALKLAKKNTKNYENIIVKYSDLFSNIHSTFDLIICNPPYLPTDVRDMDLALDGGRHGYEFTIEFLKQADQFLKPDGKILLLFSSLTKKEKIDFAITELLLTFKQLDQEKFEFEELYVYLIEKSDILKKLQKINVLTISYLDKGKRGIVYQGYFNQKHVAIKIAIERAELLNVLEKEAKWLRLLEKYRFAPRLVLQGKDFLLLEFIQGKKIYDYLEDASRENSLHVLKELLAIAHKLDELGINKEEMHHPLKHVLIQSDLRVRLIDYERSSYVENVKNVTQLCQFLTSPIMLKILEQKNIVLQKEEVIELAKQYKKENQKENKILLYKKIVALFR